jgi:hypothetical protein
MRYAINYTQGLKSVLTNVAASWLGRNPFTRLAVAASAIDWQVPAAHTVWRQGRRVA